MTSRPQFILLLLISAFISPGFDECPRKAEGSKWHHEFVTHAFRGVDYAISVGAAIRGTDGTQSISTVDWMSTFFNLYGCDSVLAADLGWTTKDGIERSVNQELASKICSSDSGSSFFELIRDNKVSTRETENLGVTLGYGPVDIDSNWAREQERLGQRTSAETRLAEYAKQHCSEVQSMFSETYKRDYLASQSNRDTSAWLACRNNLSNDYRATLRAKQTGLDILVPEGFQWLRPGVPFPVVLSIKNVTKKIPVTIAVTNIICRDKEEFHLIDKPLKLKLGQGEHEVECVRPDERHALISVQADFESGKQTSSLILPQVCSPSSLNTAKCSAPTGCTESYTKVCEVPPNGGAKVVCSPTHSDNGKVCDEGVCDGYGNCQKSPCLSDQLGKACSSQMDLSNECRRGVYKCDSSSVPSKLYCDENPLPDGTVCASGQGECNGGGCRLYKIAATSACGPGQEIKGSELVESWTPVTYRGFRDTTCRVYRNGNDATRAKRVRLSDEVCKTEYDNGNFFRFLRRGGMVDEVRPVGGSDRARVNVSIEGGFNRNASSDRFCYNPQCGGDRRCGPQEIGNDRVRSGNQVCRPLPGGGYFDCQVRADHVFCDFVYERKVFVANPTSVTVYPACRHKSHGLE